MIMIFGAIMKMISPVVFFYFYFFLIFVFWAVMAVKRQKIAQDDKKILSGALHVSGIIHHMTFIYGTHF